MQNCLDNLGFPLRVCWMPNAKSLMHGEIKSGNIFLYDGNENDAWKTFTHEIFEYRFQKVTKPYRMLVNGLIEVIEKLVYERKEEFIDSIPILIEFINKSK